MTVGRSRAGWLTVGTIFVLLVSSMSQTATADTAPTCTSPADGEPMFVTEDCVGKAPMVLSVSAILCGQLRSAGKAGR
jgi:hypothetical protein